MRVRGEQRVERVICAACLENRPINTVFKIPKISRTGRGDEGNGEVQHIANSLEEENMEIIS